MTLTHTFDPHAYFLNGRRYPSVTQILRMQGVVRFNGVPDYVLERARQRGADVHRLVHYYNEGDLDMSSVDPSYAGYLAAWRQCVKERRLRPLLCEYRIASASHRVAGTLDFLCESGGEGWLFDFCTGQLEKLAKHLQTAGYLGLAYEWAEVAKDAQLAAVLARHNRWRRAGVRLRADGTFRVLEYTDTRDFGRFFTLVDAFHIREDEGGILLPEDLAA